MCQSIEDVDRISWEAEMMRAEEHFDAVDETAEVYIYRMPDGSLKLQCGNLVRHKDMTGGRAMRELGYEPVDEAEHE